MEKQSSNKVKSKKTPNTPTIQVYKAPSARLPSYQTEGSACMDVYANIPVVTQLAPGETRLIPTGLRLKIPEGYEIAIRSRSGLALKKQVVVLNAPGTIDSDYSGELGIVLTNFGTEKFEVNRHDRIAQLSVQKIQTFHFQEIADVEDFEALFQEGDRVGGFGSTGV